MRTFYSKTVVCTVGLMALTAVGIPRQTVARDMAGPEESLVTLEDPDGWFVSLAYAASDREVRFGSRVSAVELSRLTVGAGLDILPFLTLRAEAGTVGMQVGVIESNSGFEWGVGARAAVWDYVIEGSPALPRRHAVRIEVDVAYHDASLKIGGVYLGPQCGDRGHGLDKTDEYFKWQALTIFPCIRYTHNRATEAVWNNRLPTGISVYAGPHYSDWDIEHAPREGKGNHDMAMRLGADLRLSSGWLVQLDATLYDGSDRRYTIGTGYYF